MQASKLQHGRSVAFHIEFLAHRVERARGCLRLRPRSEVEVVRRTKSTFLLSLVAACFSVPFLSRFSTLYTYKSA